MKVATMPDELSTSPCGQFLTIDLAEDWDEKTLRFIAIQATKVLQNHDSFLLLINAGSWFNQNLNTMYMLSIADSLSAFSDSQWRIAITIPELNEDNTALESMLGLKEISLKHFTNKTNAEAWLLQ